jgi:methanogenic corrinoid protein MtbC1
MSGSAQKTLLSTADIARLFHVTETTVKRWADEGMLKCQKTPGGHRKFEIRNIVEFAEKNNFEPAGVLAIPADDEMADRIPLAILGRNFPDLVSAFVSKALTLDGTDLFLLLSYLYQHRLQLWEIFDDIVCPGMVEIGERWVRGETSVCHEHRASYATITAVAKLQAQILIKPRNGLSAVLACVGDELHEIGLRCVACVLESEGWNVTYLGARIPAVAVTTAIEDLKPSLVGLSITRAPLEERVDESIRTIASAAHAAHAAVFLGGRSVSTLGFREGEVDGIHTSCRELLDALARMNGKASAGSGSAQP